MLILTYCVQFNHIAQVPFYDTNIKCCLFLSGGESWPIKLKLHNKQCLCKYCSYDMPIISGNKVPQVSLCYTHTYIYTHTRMLSRPPWLHHRHHGDPLGKVINWLARNVLRSVNWLLMLMTLDSQARIGHHRWVHFSSFALSLCGPRPQSIRVHSLVDISMVDLPVWAHNKHYSSENVVYTCKEIIYFD